MEETDDFDQTLIWAIEEENIRTTRGQNIGTFYLVVTSVIIFVICFLVLYFSNRKKKTSALDMMKDPDNEFDEFDDEIEETDEEIPLIDMSNDEEEIGEVVDEIVKP